MPKCNHYYHRDLAPFHPSWGCPDCNEYWSFWETEESKEALAMQGCIVSVDLATGIAAPFPIYNEHEWETNPMPQEDLDYIESMMDEYYLEYGVEVS